eukprot:scaffold2813_cov113-Chaetoceros_neogracile.AAC.1
MMTTIIKLFAEEVAVNAISFVPLRPVNGIFAKEPNAADGDTTKSPLQNSPPQATVGETSFETNHQVQGVDYADLIKLNGTHVFAAYADKIIVLNANDGTLLSTTVVIPTHDDEGNISAQTR